MDKPQPSLHLMSGKKALNLDSLVALYKKLTGKEPTPEELEEARQMLAQHRK